MVPSSSSSSPATYSAQPPPPPPPSSSNSTRNSKLDHIIQNFYTKTAQLIVQARLGSDGKQQQQQQAQRERRRDSKKLNKWFNIATDDIDSLRDELKYWRTLATQSLDEEPPPMIINIYLDTSKLTQNQALIVIDDNLRRNKVDLGSIQVDNSYGVRRIIIESWVLKLNHPLPDFPVDLPNLYKRSIVFFRSLHSLIRLLPAYNLYRRHRMSNEDPDISLGYQFSSRTIRRQDEIPLDTSILDGDARNPTKSYVFTDITTPLGTFKLQVNYRRNCDFKVDEYEKDIGARFVDMDEQFFTPTIARYQQNYRETPTRQRPSSMYDSRTSILSEMAQAKDIQSISPTTSRSTGNRYSYTASDSSDPREIVQQRQRHSNVVPRHSPLSSSPWNRDIKPPTDPSPSISSSSVSRRTSIPAFSPFKSPSLSSSPQAENLMSGFKNTPSPEKPKSTGGAESSSSSFGRKIEFSSSFDKYKGSPSRIDTGGTSMTRRWSRNSDHSSINIQSDMDDADLKDFVKLVGAKQELKLFQGRTSSTASQLLESTHQPQSSSPTSESSGSMGASSYGTGSIYKSKKALSHFQNLRETHNTLSDSVTSSMMAFGTGGGERDRDGHTGNYTSQDQQTESMAIMTGVSPGSSASSTGRSYQPVIPSPLHAEQHSATPVHIPRNLPPQMSHSVSNRSQESQPTTRHGRQSSQNQPTNDGYNNNSSTHTPDDQRRNQRHRISPPYQQTVALSSYPQGRHHNDLRRFNIVDDALDNDPYHEHSEDDDDEEEDDDDLTDKPTRRSRLTESRGYTTNTTNKGKGIYGMDGGSIRQQMESHPTGLNNSNRSKTRGVGNSSNLEQASAASTMGGTSPTLGASNSASTSTIPTSTSGGGGGVRTSILDDDDSLVFKMSELGGEEPLAESSTPPMTSPILFNRPAITGSSQPMFTTKRLLESSQPSTTMRRINSSDNVRLPQQHVQSLPYQLDIMNRTMDNKNGDSDSPTSDSSCKSEPASTADPMKHPPYYGRW
ncbi:autophagy-related protein 13-domain-containing protein [Chlamydoabsidia padenii]|nr:autophagy-related protein 13-domain-containing protein [Chlamydoabsidia padenii]